MRLKELTVNYLDDIVKMESDQDTSKYIYPYSINKHREEILEEKNLYLGIWDDDRLVGFIILGLEQEGKRIEFRRIVISEKGKGFGQKAILALEKYCKENYGTLTMWLDVFEFNSRGIHIYEKNGYRKISEMVFKKQKLIIMEKSL